MTKTTTPTARTVDPTAKAAAGRHLTNISLDLAHIVETVDEYMTDLDERGTGWTDVAELARLANDLRVIAARLGRNADDV